MLLVKTYVDRSPIHGLGVFAAEHIRKGAKIWRFVEGFDRSFSPKAYARLPKAARDYIKQHGYKVDGEILLTVDHDHHMNHSDDPNTYLKSGYVLARRAIRKGEEITNDYREFDAVYCAAFLDEKQARQSAPTIIRLPRTAAAARRVAAPAALRRAPARDVVRTAPGARNGSSGRMGSAGTRSRKPGDNPRSSR